MKKTLKNWLDHQKHFSSSKDKNGNDVYVGNSVDIEDVDIVNGEVVTKTVTMIVNSIIETTSQAPEFLEYLDLTRTKIFVLVPHENYAIPDDKGYGYNVKFFVSDNIALSGTKK